MTDMTDYMTPEFSRQLEATVGDVLNEVTWQVYNDLEDAIFSAVRDLIDAGFTPTHALQSVAIALKLKWHLKDSLPNEWDLSDDAEREAVCLAEAQALNGS